MLEYCFMFNVTGVSAETVPASFSSLWHAMIALFASVLSLLWRRQGHVQCSDGQSGVSKSMARAWLQTDPLNQNVNKQQITDK
jgi:hypothetical protein